MENNIVLDLVLLEADRVAAHRMKHLDLYYKDINGAYQTLGEAYSPVVEEVVTGLFKRKKMRYCISFVDTIDLLDELKPSSLKILRFFVKNMAYGNKLKNYGIREIVTATKLNMTYTTNSIKQLCEKDILRFAVDKGRREYMINPSVYYKGTMKKLFYTSKEFNKLPKRNWELEVIEEPINIF